MNEIETKYRLIQAEKLRDFIDWLFDDSGEMDHMMLSEAWDRFEEWQEGFE